MSIFVPSSRLGQGKPARDADCRQHCKWRVHKEGKQGCRFGLAVFSARQDLHLLGSMGSPQSGCPSVDSRQRESGWQASRRSSFHSLHATCHLEVILFYPWLGRILGFSSAFSPAGLLSNLHTRPSSSMILEKNERRGIHLVGRHLRHPPDRPNHEPKTFKIPQTARRDWP